MTVTNGVIGLTNLEKNFIELFATCRETAVEKYKLSIIHLPHHCSFVGPGYHLGRLG